MSVPESIVFCAAAFFANFGMSFSGWWDHGIWWALIYVIGVLAGAMDCEECEIQNALFHQAIAIGAGLPIILWSLRATIKEHHYMPFILVFGIATAGGTPIGKYLHSYALGTNIIFIATGAVSILTEINLICKMKGEAAAAAAAKEEVKDEEAKNEEKDADEVDLKGTKPLAMGFATSLLSGYLGGMCGVRGPPLLVLAKVFSLPKPIIQAHASILLAVNVYTRLIWYACVVKFKSVEEWAEGSGLEWHYMGQGYLYFFTAGFGIIGTVLGLFAASKIDAEKFKPFLAPLLLIGGILNLVQGIILSLA